MFGIINKYIKRTPFTRTVFFVVSDIFLISFSIYLAFFLRFEGQIPSQYFGDILLMLSVTLILALPIFYLNKLYSFSWSYVSAEELISLIKATTLVFAFLGVFLFFFKDYPVLIGFPRSTFFMSYFLVILLSGGIRFAKRIYLLLFRKKTKHKKERTLIVGAGDAGEQILRSILSGQSNIFEPVGFVDDSPVKQGVLIHGVKVMGKIDDIPRIIKEQRIESMIVALPSADSFVIRKAVEQARKAGIKNIKIVPTLTEIVDGKVSIADLKELKIEDLLGREPISFDFEAIQKFIQDKKILITGAAGSIGSELCRQIAKFKPGLLIALDQDETGIFNIAQEMKSQFPGLKFETIIGDILDKEKMEYVFEKFRPQIVFHAAAYKHVPLMEAHPDEAVKNNIFGTKTIAELAVKFGTEKFVFISTDKAVNPTSVMGATKRVGEMICQSLNKEGSCRFVAVRFGNVLDSRGSVIPVFKEQIKKGGPVRVTHPEMKRYFMMIQEACLLVMQAAETGKGGEVFVLDMGKPIKIIDLARELIRLSGLEPDKDIPIVFSGPRPGEKFFEDILTAEEGTEATHRDRIFIAKLAEVDKEKLESQLSRLK
ncbi:MAG TPA: polysaccharide biosynthesis protein, partial [bacterium]|nr:polysaccharide biosynthesis protein [bacterium]